MKRLISALLALAAAAFTPYLVLAEEPKPGENAFLCSLCASMMANTLSAFCGGEGEQPLQEIKLVNADTYLFSEYPVADDIVKRRETDKDFGSIPGSFLQLSDRFEDIRRYAERKGGINLIDYLVCIQASDEQIRQAYSADHGYTVDELLELVHKYQSMNGPKPEDILYEEIDGVVYYRTFPYTLIQYVGVDAFDEWKQAARWKDCLYGVTLPNCLNYFGVSNETFLELVREGGFDYFYTPERQEKLSQMRLDSTKLPGFVTTYNRLSRRQPELPEDVAKSRDENPNDFSVNGLYIRLDTEFYSQWREIADRKNPYSGKYLVDFLVNIQASDETIAKIYDQDTRINPYEIPEYSLEELLELCHKYQSFDKVPKEDILYEEAYGSLYYRTFPRTLTDYIGDAAFDQWKRDKVTQDAAHGVTLPECLDDFDISNEKFAELVKDGGFDYFFTPERLESIARMRGKAKKEK